MGMGSAMPERFSDLAENFSTASIATINERWTRMNLSCGNMASTSLSGICDIISR